MAKIKDLNFLKTIQAAQASDRELIIAYKKDNRPEHVSILYQRYMDMVFGVCLKYFKEAEKSKDAVMDIYEELCKKLRQHEVENFSGWLHVLARNYCLMQLRSPKNKRMAEFNPDFMQSEAVTHPDNSLLEKEENFKKLEQCIGELPDDQKQSIELFFLQKKCYKEIAEITGYEWNRVRSYIQNGKRNLKICLEQKNVFSA